ncbi:hypothetical protein BN1184_BO_01000 [Pantoea ananatis]|nr:hypothetical protein BN1184_BO_01000 [Pantoea ananatis]
MLSDDAPWMVAFQSVNRHLNAARGMTKIDHLLRHHLSRHAV